MGFGFCSHFHCDEIFLTNHFNTIICNYNIHRTRQIRLASYWTLCSLQISLLGKGTSKTPLIHLLKKSKTDWVSQGKLNLFFTLFENQNQTLLTLHDECQAPAELDSLFPWNLKGTEFYFHQSETNYVRLFPTSKGSPNLWSKSDFEFHWVLVFYIQESKTFSKRFITLT